MSSEESRERPRIRELAKSDFDGARLRRASPGVTGVIVVSETCPACVNLIRNLDGLVAPTADRTVSEWAIANITKHPQLRDAVRTVHPDFSFIPVLLLFGSDGTLIEAIHASAQAVHAFARRRMRR